MEGTGTQACHEAAYAGLGPENGYIESVVNSCHGTNSCNYIVSSSSSSHNGGTVGNIKDSCIGRGSCYAIAYGGSPGSVGDITSSCLGDSSCQFMSQGYFTAGSIGDISCSCQGGFSCRHLYYSDLNGGGNALSIDELSFCCNGVSECDDFLLDNFTLPTSCAAGDYSAAGDSTCSVPSSSLSPTLSPSRSPSKEPTDSPSKVVSRLYI